MLSITGGRRGQWPPASLPLLADEFDDDGYVDRLIEKVLAGASLEYCGPDYGEAALKPIKQLPAPKAELPRRYEYAPLKTKRQRSAAEVLADSKIPLKPLEECEGYHEGFLSDELIDQLRIRDYGYTRILVFESDEHVQGAARG